MRTVKQTGLPHNEDVVNFPDGTVQNETDTTVGTPVVEEVYGDILTNIYAILRDAGVDPDGAQDTSQTQYQLLQAFKRFSNELNDKRQVITVAAATLSVPIDIDNLPDNYVMTGLLSDPIVGGQTYSLSGSGSNTIDMVSDVDISASSTVLLVLNVASGKIIPLELSSFDSIIKTSLGTPIAFNDTNSLLYFQNGKILTNTPTTYDIQQFIRVFKSNNDIVVTNALAHKGKIVCFTLDTVALEYAFFTFDQSDLSTVEGEVTLVGIDPNIGVDNQPYMYCDNDFIYLTNSDEDINSNVDDKTFAKYSLNTGANELTWVSNNNLNAGFTKTTNGVIKGPELITFINGEIYKYNFNTAGQTFVAQLDAINGVIFCQGGTIYYTNGEVAVKWTL